MKTICKLALLATLSLAISTQANIIPLFNTGVDALGVSLVNGTSPDPHYSLFSVPSGSSTTVVLTSAGGFPIPPWLGDTAVSAWIRPDNGGTSGADNDPVGDYIFRTTFDLTGLDPSTASISGKWSTDNAGQSIRVNGVNTGNPGTASNQFQIGYVNFTITSGFVAGLNTLDFYVKNEAGSSGNPVGLRVELSGVAAVPEPTTIIAGALLLLPFGASTFRFIRKNRVA